VVRRARTLDPVLAELRARLRAHLPGVPAMPPRDLDRRRQPRGTVARTVEVRVNDLRLPGVVHDVGAGGLFVRTFILVEEGELGVVQRGDGPPVPVVVAWTRGAGHPMGMGMGLAFGNASAIDERTSLELVLRLLDA
jgi:hypothetical protein